MLFNSLEFLIFFSIVFAVYWMINGQKLVIQNFFILVISYVFYSWWDFRFLALIILSTLVDFSVGKLIYQSKKLQTRKLLLFVSVLANLGLLGVFKYYNFFIDGWVNLLEDLGLVANISTINIVLPVGISFYTFQTLSYTIDIYRRKLKPTSDLISFSAFVAFFPQLVAGPIERASNLLPQFFEKRKFDYHMALTGSRLILWGIFKKVVIADNCGVYVENIFSNYSAYNGITLAFGAVLFAFQIYCDFSGYSDIAIGIGRLLGFKLMRNFNYPYFSRDIAEFWRRWHISLSTWFRDYVYIPIGGSRGKKIFQIRNVLIIFLVSGLWHGANWTFVFWGFLNALYFIPILLLNKNRINIGEVSDGKILVAPKELAGILLTFALTCIAWIYFRSESVEYANDYIVHLFQSNGILSIPSFTLLGLILIFNVVEWIGRSNECPIYLYSNKKVRIAQYYLILFAIFYYGNFGHNEFIYFQF